MGGGQSGLGSTGPAGPGLGDLPENCAALILACLGPTEICRFAELNSVFRWASMADVVWESKLPANYGYLVRKLFDESPRRVGKREIYSRLSRPIRFDAGTKEIWLEKSSGKMCMAISWKGLKITGIDDRRYWSHISTEESRCSRKREGEYYYADQIKFVKVHTKDKAQLLHNTNREIEDELEMEEIMVASDSPILGIRLSYLLWEGSHILTSSEGSDDPSVLCTFIV